MKLAAVLGTRPNFVKTAPILAELPEVWDGKAAGRIVDVPLGDR